MSQADANRAAVLGIYDSMTARDLPAFKALVHSEIEVSQPAWLPYGGVHRGIDAMLAMFGRVLELVDVGRLEVCGTVADGDDVWAELVVRARADGADIRVAEHWRFEDGLARHLDVWIRDPRALVPAL